MRADIHIGDCRDVLAAMPDASVHAVVCDPPYDLVSRDKRSSLRASPKADVRAKAGGFMGLTWDASGIAFDPAFWREVLRVLRPGGHLVAFGGTRTHHRMFCAIEDAGFEIRDSLMYLYGSGFPKSLDVSKAIDKAAGAVRKVIGPPTQGGTGQGNTYGVVTRAPATAPATAPAVEWNGWGTALKPAYEPICLARKPLSESSVAKNVLRWGTGALNIDGCRIPVEDDGYARNCSGDRGHEDNRTRESQFGMTAGSASGIGRWPANGCLDEEAAVMLDGVTGGASRFFFTAKPSVAEREDGLAHVAPRTRNRVNAGGLENDPKWAPTTRRNTHPTVKPFDLMSWLVRLVTPPGGIVCDPFLGSGSTGMAAVAEGFDFIGIEQDTGFAEIAEGRIRNVAPLLVTTEIHSTAETGSLSGSVGKAATSDTSGPKSGAGHTGAASD